MFLCSEIISEKLFIIQASGHTACVCQRLHTVRLCTWRAHGDQHCGGLHPCICAEGTAVETPILLRHSRQVQTKIQGVSTADPAPVAVVFAHQAPSHFLTHSYTAPGLAVWHGLQHDLVNSAIVLMVTADGQILVLLCYQLCVRLDHAWGGGLRAVVFFWGLICKHRKVEDAQEIDCQRKKSKCVMEMKGWQSSFVTNINTLSFRGGTVI